MDDKERCPSCNESYQKASKQIVDVCGHGRCYSCLSVGGFCPLCQALLTDKVKGSSEVNSAIQATNAGSTSQVNEDANNVVESHGSDGRHVACGSGLTEKETVTDASEQQTTTNCRDVAVKSAPGVSVHQHEMSHGEMQHALMTPKEGTTHEQHCCLPEIKRSGHTEHTNSVEGANHEQHSYLPLEESGGGTGHTIPVEGASHKVSSPCSEVKINAGTEKGKSGEKTPRECKVEVNVIQDSGPDSFPLLYRNKVNQKNDKSENSVKVISNETPITQDRKCTSDSGDGEGEEGLVQAETIGKVLVKKMKNGKKRRRKAASISDKRQTSVKSCGVNNPDIVATDEQDTKQESRKERDARKKANAREKAGNVTENQPLLRKRRMRKSDGEFSCDKCGRTFNRKCHFTSHLKTHTRHNLQCHRCLTVCSDNVEYVKHGEKCKLKTRTKRKSVKDCEICGKVLTSAEGMALHLNAHKKESRHICRFCGKGIKTKYFLIVHERIHTGERPFSCEQCGNSFKDKGTLTCAHANSYRRKTIYMRVLRKEFPLQKRPAAT
ncbi:zinc finger and SCAN domain-containing protein 23-like [Ptychodera flava]|uniref:zinc finger and SCAN domain-containing protein 23-like n=1 Tax=Ptychodera flava TaxID=63121 RepID=UPI00396AAB5D